MRTDEGVVLAQDWAAGFLAAVRLRLEAWRPLLEGPAWLELLLPILVYTPDPAIEARIARLPAEARHHLAEAYRHIPTAVAALREHFLPARLDAATTLSRIH
jgi:yecA family protein